MTKPTHSDFNSIAHGPGTGSCCPVDQPVMIQQTSSAPASIQPNSVGANGSASFSLVTMFQILTACCIFFAVLRASPILAIIGTVITTPAIIRTAMAAELHQRHCVKFKLTHRIRCFLESTGLTVVTLALSATVFVLTSLAFGLICVGASLVLGMSDLATDIAFVGTAGGMVWGAAGGILAFGLCVRRWQPEVLNTPNKQ